MNSLNEHLRAGTSHDLLPFHPSCPICREQRLHGRLDPAPLLPARTQAAVVASVVAVSSGLAPAALAVEADRTSDGTAPVSQGPPADPAASSDYDPGGSDTPLAEAPPATATPAGPSPDPEVDVADAAPVDTAPAAETADPPAEPGTDAAPQPQPAPATTDASAPADSPAPPAPVPPPATPVAAPPSAQGAPEQAQSEPRRSTARTPSPRAEKRAPRSSDSTATLVAASASEPEPASDVATAPATTAPNPPVRVSVAGALHVVKPGESLWAIADAILGGDASAAQIAREVNRLWDLNRERIGTGNPNLLAVGTRLQLR